MFEVIWLTLCIGLLLVLNLKGFDLALAILVATTLYLMVYPQLIPVLAIKTLTNYKAIELALTIAMISVLSHLMEINKQIENILGWLQTHLKPKWVMISIPAFLGLLPSPSSALFSANILKNLEKKYDGKEILTLINVWYKRSMSFIHPLMPSLLLLTKFSQTSVSAVILLQIPTFLFAFLIGLLLTKKFNDSLESNLNRTIQTTEYNFFVNLAPIVVPVFLTLAGIPIILSVTAGILTSLLITKAQRVKKLFLGFREFDIKLFFAVIGIFYFVEAIQTTGTFSLIFNLDKNYNNSLLIVTVPFLVAYLVGVPFAAVPISFIILSPIISTPTDVSLFYVASTCGSILSPLDIVNVVSMKQFEIRYSLYFKRIFVLVITTLIFHFTLMSWCRYIFLGN